MKRFLLLILILLSCLGLNAQTDTIFRANFNYISTTTPSTGTYGMMGIFEDVDRKGFTPSYIKVDTTVLVDVDGDRFIVKAYSGVLPLTIEVDLLEGNGPPTPGVCLIGHGTPTFDFSIPTSEISETVREQDEARFRAMVDSILTSHDTRIDNVSGVASTNSDGSLVIYQPAHGLTTGNVLEGLSLDESTNNWAITRNTADSLAPPQAFLLEVPHVDSLIIGKDGIFDKSRYPSLAAVADVDVAYYTNKGTPTANPQESNSFPLYSIQGNNIISLLKKERITQRFFSALELKNNATLPIGSFLELDNSAYEIFADTLAGMSSDDLNIIDSIGAADVAAYNKNVVTFPSDINIDSSLATRFIVNSSDITLNVSLSDTASVNKRLRLPRATENVKKVVINLEGVSEYTYNVQPLSGSFIRLPNGYLAESINIPNSKSVTLTSDGTYWILEDNVLTEFKNQYGIFNQYYEIGQRIGDYVIQSTTEARYNSGLADSVMVIPVKNIAPGGRNILLDAENINAFPSAWTFADNPNRITITENSTQGVDGKQTAEYLVKANSSTNANFFQTITTDVKAGDVFTLSVYAKLDNNAASSNLELQVELPAANIIDTIKASKGLNSIT